MHANIGPPSNLHRQHNSTKWSCCVKHVYTLTGGCIPRPQPCSLTCAITTSHQVVSCIATVVGSLSKCCSSSVSNTAIVWVSQRATIHSCRMNLYYTFQTTYTMHVCLIKNYQKSTLSLQSTCTIYVLVEGKVGIVVMHATVEAQWIWGESTTPVYHIGSSLHCHIFSRYSCVYSVYKVKPTYNMLHFLCL